jgi:hypothetical protein
MVTVPAAVTLIKNSGVGEPLPSSLRHYPPRWGGISFKVMDRKLMGLRSAFQISQVPELRGSRTSAQGSGVCGFHTTH